MKVVNRSALIPYSARQMYELVRDIESYPDFLPWCSSACILESFPDGICGQLVISKGGLKHSFSTRNTLTENREITMVLEDGPFSMLQGVWQFEPIGDAGSRVSLHLQFDFSGALARMTIAPLFGSIADRMVDAFVERAAIMYQ